MCRCEDILGWSGIGGGVGAVVVLLQEWRGKEGVEDALGTERKHTILG